MIYNPFKPHIASNGLNYIVRRLTYLGWEHLDREDQYWWFTKKYINKYCVVQTKAEAEQMLKRVQPYKKI